MHERGFGFSVHEVYRHFQQYFSYILTFIVIGGGNRGIGRKLPTDRKSMINFITYCCIKYITPWAGFELTILVVMGIDYTGSCKSNYHSITTTISHVHQGFLVAKLKLSLRKFSGCHHVLVNRCGVSVSQMTTYMFRWSESQSGPFFIFDLSPSLGL